MKKTTREDDYKDPKTGSLHYGRNTILDEIRIRKSQIIAYHYPKQFPHLVPLTKEQEQRNEIRLSRGSKIIHFERLAVTEGQILDYGLPDEPKDRKTMEKLRRDTRYDSHIEKYGRLIAAEVDALDALHPEVLRELVQKSVDDRYDPEVYKSEILDKYGSKEYKKKVNDMVIEKLEAMIVKLRRRSDEDDFEDETLEEE